MSKGIWTWGLALLLLGAGAARAEPDAAASGLDERIDLALKDAAPDDVFRTFAKMLSAEAVVDPGVTAPVSVELHNVRARTLLDTICESIGCRWTLEPGNPPKLRVTAAPGGGKAEGGGGRSPDLRDPIDLRVTKANGVEILHTFGEILGADVVIDPRIAGTVSLELKHTPVDQSLDTVCQALSCDWTYTEGRNGKRPVLRVFSRKK
jgi:type II secretory pathway component GspD/PulD (secretin)